MSMKKWMMVAAAGLVMASGMASVHAGDVEAGKAKYVTCMACHGPAGQGQAIFPAVAGKDAEELAAKLTAYRAGEQVGPNTALMAPHAQALSDEDIANLAAYMASL
jgi:cytochrome c